MCHCIEAGNSNYSRKDSVQSTCRDISCKMQSDTWCIPLDRGLLLGKSSRRKIDLFHRLSSHQYQQHSLDLSYLGLATGFERALQVRSNHQRRGWAYCHSCHFCALFDQHSKRRLGPNSTKPHRLYLLLFAPLRCHHYRLGPPLHCFQLWVTGCPRHSDESFELTRAVFY